MNNDSPCKQKELFLKDTYPWNRESDVYISLRVIEIPEPFVPYVKEYLKELSEKVPVRKMQVRD